MTTLSKRLSKLCQQMSGSELPTMIRSKDRVAYAREFASMAEAARHLEAGRPVPAGLFDADLPERPVPHFVE